MVEQRQQTPETESQQSPVEAFLAEEVDGILDGSVVDRALQELKKPDYATDVTSLKKLRDVAAQHIGAVMRTIEGHKATASSGGEGGVIDKLVRRDTRVVELLTQLMKEADNKVAALEAKSRVEANKARAQEAINEAAKELPEGLVTGADLISNLAAVLNVDVSKLGMVGAMFDRMAQQAAAGEAAAKKDQEKPEGRTTAEAVKLIKENLEAVKAAFGSRYTEQDIDNLAGFADGSNSPWLNPIKWIQQARGVDFKARLMKMADVAEKAAQEKDVAPVFAEIGMGDPDKLIPKYAEDIKEKGIKGVPETYTDNNGDEHPLRDMLKAHLLLMVDFGLIKHEGWMNDSDAQAAQKKVMDKIGGTHSVDLIAYYRRRLKTITDAFPSVKLDGDEEPEDQKEKKDDAPNPRRAAEGGDSEDQKAATGSKDDEDSEKKGGTEKKGELTAEDVAEKLGVGEDQMERYRKMDIADEFTSAGIFKLINDIESIPDTDERRADKVRTILNTVNPDTTYGPAIMAVEKNTPKAAEARDILQKLIDAIDGQRK